MTFKKCCANHKKSFNSIKSKNDTTLSTEYCTSKQKQQAPRLTWEIKGQYKAYNPSLKISKLCLNERDYTQSRPKPNEQEVRSNLSLPPPNEVI